MTAISIEEHEKLMAEAVKDALASRRIEVLEKSISTIEHDIKEHIIQSRVNSDALKEAIVEAHHVAEQRSARCQQDLKNEFYGHLADRYATKEYVDTSVKYMKLAAIFGAVSFLSTIIGFVVIISKIG